MLDAEGQVRDLSGVSADIRAGTLSPTPGAAARRSTPAACRWLANPGRIGRAVERVGKFICIGLNYADHAAEPTCRSPKEPIVFMKAISAPSAARTTTSSSRAVRVKTDWEVELGVVIGTPRTYVPRPTRWTTSPATASSTTSPSANTRLERGGTWDKGKGCDTFGPIGPWLVTADEVADPQKLDDVARRRRPPLPERHHPHDDLRRRPDRQLLSHFMTLNPGDVITTGTPPGVGMGQKPGAGLPEGRRGDALGIEGLGEQQPDRARVGPGLDRRLKSPRPMRQRAPPRGRRRWRTGGAGSAAVAWGGGRVIEAGAIGNGKQRGMLRRGQPRSWPDAAVHAALAVP